MTQLNTGTDTLLCTLSEGVATITLNRPDKRNALSDELTPALREILLVLESEPAARCIVITGSGTAFCAGGDVSGMGASRAASQNRKPNDREAIRSLQIKQETLTLRLHRHSKPTIAALPGPAAGAGMSIALACDMRIAAESAFITTAFANIGLSGDYGGSWLLTRLVGTAIAKELYFTARRVGAAEGVRLGLFNKMVPDNQLAATTREFALQIAKGPPVALQYMKDNLNRALTCDLSDSLLYEAEKLIKSAATEDHREAVQAFLEKREAVFKGH